MQKGVIFVRAHVDATWRSGARGSATQTVRVPAWHGCDVYIYIYLLVLVWL